ncbi:MAG: serine hydrolase domain-containing protein [Bacteroidia bacterium]
MTHRQRALSQSLFLLLFASIIISCRLAPSTQISQRLQPQLDSLREATDLAGIAVAIIPQDGELINLFSGYADRERQTPFKASDRLLMGSVGKTYVSALVLQEIEKGTLKLDDQIAAWFSTKPWYDSLANAPEITIEMLLNHTSGLPRWVFKPAVWQSMQADPNKVWSHEDRLEGILGDPALHPAGKGWAYSDTNYLLLGMILEAINGKTFYELLAERLLLPNGLTDTRPSDQRALFGLVAGYTAEGNPFQVPAKVSEDGVYAINPQFEWTGGGLMCTPADLARWARLLYSGEILPKAQMQQMLSTAPYPTRLPGEAKYGLGIMVREDDLGANYGHEGFMPGFQTVVLHYPEQQFTIALMVNEDQLSGKHTDPLYVWASLLARQIGRQVE